MRQSDIDEALERLEEYGGADDARKLIIAVIEKDPDTDAIKEYKEMIAKDYGEELEEIEDSLEGARLGYLMRAEDAKEYGLWEADHVFLHMDGGNVYSYTHIPNTIAYVRDEDYHLRGAMAVDQNAEMATLDEAVNQILGW